MNRDEGIGSRLVVALSAGLLACTACAPDPPSAVVGIIVDSCDPGQDRGSGMAVGPGLVLTSAHTLAGARDIRVEQDGQVFDATVVGFDPEMDLAYLHFDGPTTPVLPVDSGGIEPGEHGVAYVVRGDTVEVLPVQVRRRVNIRTEDIYIDGEYDRPGMELVADIRPGDSGGAVVVDGAIVGVLWARSRAGERRAYAIDPDRAGATIEQQLRTGRIGSDIDLERCH